MIRKLASLLPHLMQPVSMLGVLLVDAAHILRLLLRSHAALAAENLFLRKQLALYQERHVTSRRATNATRFALVWLAPWFDWRQALAIVQPAALTHWHRQGFRLVWRWQSTPGRPPIPADLQALIRRMARENPTWGGGAHRQRTVAEARPARVTTHGTQVHAQARGPWPRQTRDVPTLEHFCPQSCPGDRGL